jgi:hypothetical protein
MFFVSHDFPSSPAAKGTAMQSLDARVGKKVSNTANETGK